jgi:hypothetical protein
MGASNGAIRLIRPNQYQERVPPSGDLETRFRISS